MKRFLFALLAFPAVAVAQPRLVPGHDVDVLYQLSGAAADRIPGGAPDGVRLQWDARGQRLRAEPVGRATYTLTDLNRRVTDVVFTGQNAALELPIRGGDPQTLLAGADVHFTRRGADRLLGLDCTEWAVQSRKLDAVGCVTADGVVLRVKGTFDGQPGNAVATSVKGGPIPGEVFRIPDGVMRLAMPGGR